MRTASTPTPRRVKYTTNDVRPNNLRRSSNECVGSATMPNMPMRTAPTTTKRVPKSMNLENTSPRITRAKNAFHNKETAPSGAKITTGRDAIWKTEPSTFDDINIARGCHVSTLIAP